MPEALTDIEPAVVDGAETPLVRLDGISRTFRAPGGRGLVRAVDGVDLTIEPGEALGLVGESGSGKSTLARCVLGLIRPTEGRVLFEGRDLTALGGRDLRRLRAEMQMVFQDPLGSLDPRQTVRSAIEEPMRLLTHASSRERRERLLEVIELVHLDRAHLDRYPHQLSGGQQQRVGIARAMITSPKLFVLDEPTSALDWPIRAGILELLDNLRRTEGFSYLLISHDLSAVRYVCDRVAVMYLGRIVEQATVGELFEQPEHPYTKVLMSALLEPETDARSARLHLAGEPASPIDLPSGCRLHPRCPIARPQCGEREQELRPFAPEHEVACWRITSGDEIAWPTGWSERRLMAN